MQLYHKKLGEGQPIVILHGLFGSSDNWLSIGKKLAEEYQVFLVDQRNHGRSPWNEEWNYDVMSDDLHEFILSEQIEKPIIIGHSMGGKTAMNYAVRYPDNLEKLVVVDISPRSYPIHHDYILKALLSIDLEELKGRKDADIALESFIADTPTRQFLLKNLYRDDKKKFAWRINLNLINDKIAEVGEALSVDFSGVLKVPTLFIKGEKSNYIQAKDEQLIQSFFPQATIDSIPNAGHWVHAEASQAFLEAILSFLEAPKLA